MIDDRGNDEEKKVQLMCKCRGECKQIRLKSIPDKFIVIRAFLIKLCCLNGKKKEIYNLKRTDC